MGKESSRMNQMKSVQGLGMHQRGETGFTMANVAYTKNVRRNGL